MILSHSPILLLSCPNILCQSTGQRKHEVEEHADHVDRLATDDFRHFGIKAFMISSGTCLFIEMGLRGANTIGPMPKPSTKTQIERLMTSPETCRLLAVPGRSPVGMALPNATARHRADMPSVTNLAIDRRLLSIVLC
jgi:hypothetical protein